MSAPDASKTDQDIMSVLRETRAERRTNLVQNWVRSWHRKNCAPSRELDEARRFRKVMGLKIARQEKEIAALKALQAPAEKVKLGHMHCKKAGGFKSKTIKAPQIKKIKKASRRPPS